MRNGQLMLLRSCVAFVLMLGVAQAQDVRIGPILASGTPGSPVDFLITYQGPPKINGISFNVIYDSEAMATFSPVLVEGSKIQCATASDLPPDIQTSGVLLVDRGIIAFTVIGLNLSTGAVPFGRSGVLGSCSFVIAGDAPGTIPLVCDRSPGATTASDVNGKEVFATCVDGTLTVAGGAEPSTGGSQPPAAPVAPAVAAGGVEAAPAGGGAPGQPARPQAPAPAPAQVARNQGQVQAPTPQEEAAEEATPNESPGLEGKTPSPQAAGATAPAAGPTPARTAQAETALTPTIATAPRTTVARAATPTRAATKAAVLATPSPAPEKSGCQLEKGASGCGVRALGTLLLGLVILRRTKRSASCRQRQRYAPEP